MSTTLRDSMNVVLTNLGEPVIAASTPTITSALQLLVLGFYNAFLAEVQAAHNWRALQVTNTVSVLANTTVTLIPWANEHSRVVRWQNAKLYREVPLVFDVTTATAPFPLYQYTLAELIYKETINVNTANTQNVTAFCLDNRAGNKLYLRSFPQLASPATIQLTLVVPQAPFTVGDLSTVISIPTTGLEMGATWYALEDRGEELGPNAMFSEARFRQHIDDLIALDSGEAGTPDLVPV